MTLSILLSGAIGAILASIIAVVASAWREQIRLRGLTAIEVAGWLEDLRATREQFFTARHLFELSMAGPKYPEMLLRWEDRLHAIGDRLTVLAQTKKPVVQVAIAYGEGGVVDTVDKLQSTAERLVMQEIQVIGDGGLKALESDEISSLRSAFDHEQESLLQVLVRGGSLPHMLCRRCANRAPSNTGSAV